ncbi:MAG: AAA family ATPase, partial [Planctomycetota bacterium]
RADDIMRDAAGRLEEDGFATDKAQLRESLVVGRGKRSEMIEVESSASDRAEAVARVNAVIATFSDSYRDSAAEERETRLGMLADRESKLREEIASLRDSISQTYSYDGALSDDVWSNALAASASLESQRRNLELAIVAASAMPQPTEAELLDTTDVASDLARRIAAKRLELLDAQSSFGDQHPTVVRLSGQLDVLRRAAAQEDGLAESQETTAVRDNPETSTGTGPVAEARRLAAMVGPEAYLPALESQLEHVEQLASEATARVADLRTRRDAAEPDRARLATLSAEADELARAYAKLEREPSSSERLEILSPARSARVESDTRLKSGAAGGVVGAGLGFMMVLGFSALRRRVDGPGHVAELVEPLPMLGTLPHLGSGGADAGAAEAIHRARGRLQIEMQRHGARTVCVTGGEIGSGKTSVSFGLACSFASSRQEVLIIDGDLAGRGMTNRLNVVENQQATAEVATAEVTPDMSIYDVLRGDAELRSCIYESRVPGVWVLSGGDEHRPADASAEAVARLIEEARSLFKVVIVDTGPLMGATEAPLFAQQCDLTVLCTARGDRSDIVQRAAAELRQIGSRVAGVIFNRASRRDAVHTSGVRPRLPRNQRLVAFDSVLRD